MISNKLKALCGMVLMGGMMVSGTAIAANEAMKKFFETQLQNGNITQQQYDDLIKALEKDNQAMEKQVDEKVSEATKDVPKITTKEKLEIESQDGNFKWGIGGRIMWDTAFYDNDADINGTNTELGSGHELRRARLEMGATLWKVWKLKFQYDFTEVGDSVEGIRDMYIQYTGFKPATFTIGHYKEPFSLEELTSSKYITFMERAQPVGLAPSRNLGAGADTTLADMVGLQGGVFGEGVDSGGGPDTSGYGFTGRAYFSPIHESDRVLHVGVAGGYRNINESDTIRFRERMESHVTSTRLIDTGDFDAEDITLLGLEAAGVLGPFSLQGEYIRTNVNRAIAGNPDVDIDGWYVFGSWFLTGESRNYEFDKGGAFGSISPNSVVGKGGYGAWEVAARFSSLDLNDGDILGGEQDIFTAGLNWYPTKNLRFMVNYNTVIDRDENGNFPGAEPAVIQGRAQVYW